MTKISKEELDAFSDEEDLEDGQMSLFEHLGELRMRIIRSLIFIVIGAALSWIWVEHVFNFLMEPLRVAAPTPEMAKVHYKDMSEPFITMIKTALFSGVFVTIPFVLYQVWKFIAPALYKHEKRVALPFVFLATIFFYTGATFCYYIVMPFGFQFLFKFSAQIASPTIMMSEHYAMVVKMMLAFAVVFEMPVFTMFLSALGVLTHRPLIAYWRYSVVGIFLAAAVLTPPDVLSQLAMAVPMVLLYGLSIIVAYFFTRRHEAAASDIT
jgi:sec-independent protein translocase protein TatC